MPAIIKSPSSAITKKKKKRTPAAIVTQVVQDQITPKQRKNDKIKKLKLKGIETRSKGRAEMDELIRQKPHKILWQQYLKWIATENEKNEDKIEMNESKPFTSSQIISIVDDCGSESLIDKLKTESIVDQDYKSPEKSGFPVNDDINKNKKEKQKILPGISCLMLALSTQNLLSFSTRLYDQVSVPKLFSKHVKLKVHSRLLNSLCFHSFRSKQQDNNKKRKHKGDRGFSVIPTASGTIGRIEKLITENCLTLKYTKYLCVDMSRDVKLYNFFDGAVYSHTFFHLLHNHYILPYLNNSDDENQYKIILVIPSEDNTLKERTLIVNETKVEQEGNDGATADNAANVEHNTEVDNDETNADNERKGDGDDESEAEEGKGDLEMKHEGVKNGADAINDDDVDDADDDDIDMDKALPPKSVKSKKKKVKTSTKKVTKVKRISGIKKKVKKNRKVREI